MNQLKTTRLTILTLALAALFAFSAAPACAEGLSPWFRVSSVSRPGNLAPAKVTVDEVQELTVAAAHGEFYLNGEEALGLPFDATEGEVKGVLEDLYGAGDVEVAAKRVIASEEAEHIRRYLITFTGSLRYKPVGLIQASSVGVPLTLKGGEKGGIEVKGDAAIEASQLSEGAFQGSEIVVSVVNLGDASASFEPAAAGAAATVTDTLPAGLKALFVEGRDGLIPATSCNATTVSCTFAAGDLAPFAERVEVTIGVAVEPGASSGEVNSAGVSGGEGFACHEVAPGAGAFTDGDCLRPGAGNFEREATGAAPSASASHAVSVSDMPSPFGVEDYEMRNEEAGGAVDTHAGSHPFQTTFTLNLNEELAYSQKFKTELGVPAGLAKDLTFKLPAGFIGDPSAYGHCSLVQFGEHGCPSSSVVGVASVTFNEENVFGELAETTVPIYNMEPDIGEPARFGFQPDGVPVFIDTSIRTGGDYGVTAHVENIPQTVGFLANTVTLWGVPGDSRHDDARGSGCLAELNAAESPPPCVPASGSGAPPFLSLPTSCGGELESSVEGDSWQQPGVLTPPVVSLMPALVGCGSLQFGSEITVKPDVESGSTPSGLAVDVHVPQEEALNATGLAPADVKSITVTLPEGLQLNPSAADGLDACTQEQVGLDNDSEAACPNGSKIATATITTPLLPNKLKGFVYLASPQNFSVLSGAPKENPFSSLVAMYLVVRDPVSGVLVKLAGQVSLSATGQITATFANDPQLPFEDAEVEFFGGERAPLATPERCGSYTTTASFEPWTNPPAGNPSSGAIDEVLHSSSEFHITSGPAAAGGGPGGYSSCSDPLPFNASLSSGTTNVNAGSFTPLSTTLSRPSGDQPIQSVTLHYPAGVLGLLPGVKLCPEAQANTGTCPPESQIGETIVSVGVGGDPFTVTGGKVYLTEKYAGAPFGLSIVNPAKAGPFDLQEGRPVVVRAKVEVDPLTAALTITTDGSGTLPGGTQSHAIPNLIEGFALQIQHVNVLVNRPGFTFNPTNCNPTKITGQINSSEGAGSPVEVPFQVTNCAALKFEPKVTVSTSGKTSKSHGASLSLDLTKPVAQGAQANIAKFKVELPKQLPSRLTTLQKACTAAQFNANPAGCPAASVVGHMKVSTPLVPVPLEGPMYFVSNGGEAFPNLIIVLQGYGVTEHLIGDTFISKTGVTSSTFNAIPDVPFSAAEVTLPEGPYSALAANGNLCDQNLRMPTEFTAQNGATLSQNTHVEVTGCPSSISIESKTINKRILKLSAYAPGAGRVMISGKGLSSETKSYTGQEAQSFTLTQKKAGKLRTSVKLTFTPSKGKKQSKSIAISFKK